VQILPRHRWHDMAVLANSDAPRFEVRQEISVIPNRHELCSAVCVGGWLPTYERGQDIRDRTFAFACRVVALCKVLYQTGGVGRMVTTQLLNCSTSVAAMLEEARAAESKRDFLSKCSIALKEARESHVRLRVCQATGLGALNQVRPLVQEAHEIVSILSAIIRNTRRRLDAAGVAPQARARLRIPNS
jgi:four helix bundle protein